MDDSKRQIIFVQSKIPDYDRHYIEESESRRYSNNYIIKFVGFMSIYYVINLDIVSIYCKFESIKLYFIG